MLPLYFSRPDIAPIVYTLSGMLVVVLTADAFRLNYTPFERLYERVLGFLMRESEKVDPFPSYHCFV